MVLGRASRQARGDKKFCTYPYKTKGIREATKDQPKSLPSICHFNLYSCNSLKSTLAFRHKRIKILQVWDCPLSTILWNTEMKDSLWMACLKIKPYRLKEHFTGWHTLRGVPSSRPPPYQWILNVTHNVDINTHEH